MSRQQSGNITITITLLLALMLEIMPLPDGLSHFQPQWLLLTLIYWCMATPNRVGIGVSWSCGIMLDILNGALLGQHAIGLAIVAYFSLKLHQRTRVLPLPQQALTVLLLLLVERLISIWVIGAVGYPAPSLWYWATPLVGMVLWPWFYVVLRDVRRRFRVS
ncbi:MAG: rod shape-determining protein MreD [Candidatus Polarisedimenticolaceae bacterium]|nr:rod shape-determining protein MreD [Candidatus Polarisedimenticolaceae bacterium]